MSDNVTSPRLWTAICLLLSFGFFADALVGHRTVLPTGFVESIEPWKSELDQKTSDEAQQYDLIFQFYPWAHFFKESIKSGEIPLWNPYSYLGTPFLANPQTALLFPFTWIHLIFPLKYSFTLIFILKLAAASLGMFYWLRSQPLSNISSLFGSVVFAFSMHTVVSVPFPYSNVTILLPWTLLTVSRLAAKPTGLRFLAAVTVFSLAGFAGQPQSVLPLLLVVALFLAFHQLGKKTGLIVTGTLILAPLVAGLITAVQWLPSFLYAWESMIREGPRIIKSGYPYEPGTFLNLLIPDFFGSHLDGTFWGFPGYHDTAFYSSVIALLLVPIAFFRKSPRSYRPQFFLLSGLLLALGIVTGLFLFEFLLDIPGFDLIRRNKFVFLIVFFIAQLSAHGLERLRLIKRIPFNRLGATTLLLLVLSGFGIWWFHDYLIGLDLQSPVYVSLLRVTLLLILSFVVIKWLPRRLIPVGLLVLVSFDLITLSYGLNPRGDDRALYPKLPLVEKLEGSPPRIYSLDSTFRPNSGMPYRLQDVRGYDVMTPRRFFRYMQTIDSSLGNVYDWLMRIDPETIHANTRMRRILGSAILRYGKELTDYLKSESYWSVAVHQIERIPLFTLLQIDYLFSERDLGIPDLTLQYESDTFGVYRNQKSVREKLFWSWIVRSPFESLGAIATIDTEHQVVIESHALQAETASGSGTGYIRQVQSSPQSYQFELSTNRDAIFVQFERFSAGWTASLDDGKEIPVFPANHVFRGIHIPAGKHNLTLQYRPAEFTYGCVLSCAGWVLLVIIGVGFKKIVSGANGTTKRSV